MSSVSGSPTAKSFVEVVTVSRDHGDSGSLPVGRLLSGELFDVYRMEFSKGKSLPEHQTSCAIIVQCLAGRIEFAATGVANELVAGQFLSLEANEPHSLKAFEDSVILLTKVRTPLLVA